MANGMLLLVGDNPFHRVSHLSQERATLRERDITSPEYAAGLVNTAFENGADGFMFTISTTTLSLLRTINHKGNGSHRLYAIAPYAYEFVRLAAAVGGIPGLARRMAGDILRSGCWQAVVHGAKGVLTTDPAALYRSYLAYEIGRLKLATGGKKEPVSLLTHEVVTDMALALGMDWLFKTHINYLRRRGIRPGFETRNFSQLVKSFAQWGIGLDGTVIAAPFNRIGFQMCPSREESEAALSQAEGAEVIAFSILAAGYLNVAEAIEYISSLSRLGGVAVGVSKPSHASETFRQLSRGLK